jgi:hypothetical protein
VNLRPAAARFFGKILKLDRTVTPRQPTSLPGSRSRPGRGAGRGILLCTLWLAGAAAAAPPVATPPAASVYSRVPGAAAAGPRPSAAGGQPEADAAQAERIVTGALLQIGRGESFAARLRQKARMGDRVLVGSGRYVQSGRGEDLRFRFETALEGESESFEQLEVCDGLFCWIYRRAGPEPPTLQRIDVRRVRDRLEQRGAPADVDAAPYLGGLPRTLWLLRERFRFELAEADEIDGAAVWSVEGRWHPERLAGALPEIADAARRPGGATPAELPDGFPWAVRLSVGRADLVVRRIEWLGIPGPRPVADGVPEPIAVLDVGDVEIGGRVDPAAFFYQPAAVGLMDVTEAHVAALSLWRP